jgi:hypothetical protein
MISVTTYPNRIESIAKRPSDGHQFFGVHCSMHLHAGCARVACYGAHMCHVARQFIVTLLNLPKFKFNLDCTIQKIYLKECLIERPWLPLLSEPLICYLTCTMP